MVRVETRRRADPQEVQRLWEAITFIRNQKQVANNERIQKYMQRQYGTSETDCMWQVSYASEDGLILKEISTGKKGSRAGLAQEAFWCVEDSGRESENSHDWYCFTCHKPGRVWCCDTCHRVFHPQCLTDEKEGINEDKWSCAVCQSLKKDTFRISKGTLYKLLDYVLARMKDKARQLHRKLKLSVVPNYYHLVYRHVDLGTIMENVEQKKYKTISEFEVSAQDMVHTTGVYYGIDSDRMRLSQLTLNDCRYDLAEIRLCVDCYLASNNKVGDDWFCTPCNPVHELAWVHMKGFGFWPAKILCRNEGRVDVRFFGKRHERALVPENDVRHINTDLKQLRIKKSKGWQNAQKELDHHKVLIDLGVTPVRDEEEEASEENIEETDKNPETKKGTKRKIEQQREAEEFVKKSHSDAGQVNSISTSQEHSRGEKTKKKRRKVKEETNPDTPLDQNSQEFDTPGVGDSPSPHKDKNSGDSSPKEGREGSIGGGEGTSEESENREKGGSGKGEGIKKEGEEGKKYKWGEGTKKEEDEGKKKDKGNGAKKNGNGRTKKEEEQKTKEEGGGTAGTKNKGKKGKSAGCNDIGGSSNRGGSSSGSVEEDFEMKYRIKLADYKAHQEMEFQTRVEKAVEEAISLAQKKWEMEQSAMEAENVAQMEQSIEEARKEEREKLAEEHENEIKQLKERHKEEISQTKKRQWCINCGQEAMYHCCWNTSYCSQQCQQIHWHKEHKRLCRRKRPN